MNPGYCGFLAEPDWYDEAEAEEFATAIPNGDDRICFIDFEGIPGRSWMESDLTISLGDAR